MPRGVAGTGVSTSQGAAAQVGIACQFASVEFVQVHAGLHVAQLANVVVATADARPAEEQVAGRLHDALTINDALAVIAARATPGAWLQNRGARLLDLQEERVLVVRAEQQRHVAARADAADADHLARQVDRVDSARRSRAAPRSAMPCSRQPVRQPPARCRRRRCVSRGGSSLMSQVSVDPLGQLGAASRSSGAVPLSIARSSPRAAPGTCLT